MFSPVHYHCNVLLERRWGEVRKTDTRVAGAGGGYAKATGSNAGAETGRRPLLEFRRSAS